MATNFISMDLFTLLAVSIRSITQITFTHPPLQCVIVSYRVLGSFLILSYFSNNQIYVSGISDRAEKRTGQWFFPHQVPNFTKLLSNASKLRFNRATEKIGVETLKPETDRLLWDFSFVPCRCNTENKLTFFVQITHLMSGNRNVNTLALSLPVYLSKLNIKIAKT